MDGFAVLAEPTRRRIVEQLRTQARDVTELMRTLGVSQSLMSKHLKVLRDAGVVTAEVAGKRRIYRLSDDPLPDVLAWVDPFCRGWSRSFDALAAALDADQTDHDGGRNAATKGNR